MFGVERVASVYQGYTWWWNVLSWCTRGTPVLWQGRAQGLGMTRERVLASAQEFKVRD